MQQMSLEETQKCALNILLEIRDIFDKYKISYQLTGGTLLGAVRHKGFIPWDDDVDITISILDYRRALKCIRKDSKYDVLDGFSDISFPATFAKVYDQRTILVDEDKMGQFCRRGVSVDIFPTVRWDGKGIEYRKFEFMVRRLYYPLTRAYFFTKAGGIKDRIIGSIMIILGVNLVEFKKKLFNLEYEANNLNGPVTQIWNTVYPCTWESKFFEEEKQLGFCNHFFSVPIGYDAILKESYGDYMIFPPVEERVSHHTVQIYKLMN